MVSFSLTWRFTLACLCKKFRNWAFPPMPQVRPHRVEVGKTLALYRMRQWGISGNWQNYTTTALRMV